MRFLLIIVISSWLLPRALLAQNRTTSNDLGSGLRERTPAAVTQPSGVAFESTVDPERYFVGPSDVFSVNVWMSPPST